MPVSRNYLFQDGTIMTSADPEWERRFREHLMKTLTDPEWRNDPTYNMRRKR